MSVRLSFLYIVQAQVCGLQACVESADSDGYEIDDNPEDGFSYSTAKSTDGSVSDDLNYDASLSSFESDTYTNASAPSPYPWAEPHPHDFFCESGDEIPVLCVDDKSWRPAEVFEVDATSVSLHFPRKLHHCL